MKGELRLKQLGFDRQIELNLQGVRTGLGLVEDVLPLVSERTRNRGLGEIRYIKKMVDNLEEVLIEAVKNGG
jgi:hypothetical protein